MMRLITLCKYFFVLRFKAKNFLMDDYRFIRHVEIQVHKEVDPVIEAFVSMFRLSVQLLYKLFILQGVQNLTTYLRLVLHRSNVHG